MSDCDKKGTFGVRLKQARQRIGLTQQELGEMINVTAQAVSQYEQDKRRPGFEIVYNIAGILKCDIRWLLSGSTEDTKEDYLGDAVKSLPGEALDELKSFVDYLLQKYKK